jgi:hypothetical protein
MNTVVTYFIANTLIRVSWNLIRTYISQSWSSFTVIFLIFLNMAITQVEHAPSETTVYEEVRPYTTVCVVYGRRIFSFPNITAEVSEHQFNEQ